MDSRIDKLVDEATIGLKDDPELRLDVRAELRAHLQETAEQHITSAETEDRIDHAIKAFGSPAEIAGDLLDANKRRMKLRALVRLGVRRLLIPAALVVAIFIGYNGIARVTNLAVAIAKTHQQLSGGIPVENNAPMDALPDLPALSFSRPKPMRSWGIPDRNSSLGKHTIYEMAGYRWYSGSPDIDRLYQLSQKNSHNSKGKIYYGYYAAWYSSRNSIRSEQEIALFESLMRQGERLDPGNALYNYHLANIYLVAALDNYWVKNVADPKEKHLEYSLRDRAIMERGLAEYRKGLAKPYLRSYHTEMVRERIANIPAVPRSEYELARLLMIYSELFPEYSFLRDLTRRVSYCADLLAIEGRMREAEPLLQSWKPYAMQLIASEPILLNSLVATACGKILSHSAIQTYEKLGLNEKARAMEQDYQRFSAPVIKLKEWKSENGSIVENNLRDHGGLLARTFVPTDGLFLKDASIGLKYLSTLRGLEQNLLEQFTANLLQIFLMAVLVGSAVAQWYWLRKLRDGQDKPLLLLPNWPALLRILGLGILLPLAAYLVYTRLSGMAGREFSIFVIWPRILAELGVLVVILLVAPAAIAGRLIRKRCRQLGIPVPTTRQENVNRLALLLLPAAAAGSLLCFRMVQENILSMPYLIVLAVLAGAIMQLVLVAILTRKLFAIFRQQDFRVFYSTVARSVAPVYALTILLVGGLALPYLAYDEARILTHGKDVFPRVTATGITMPEIRITEDLQRQMLQALEELPVSIEKSHSQ